MDTHQTMPTNKPKALSLRFALARLFWLYAGPMIMLLTSFSIVRAGSGWTTYLDAVFLVVLGLTIFARWYELHSGHGCDGFGNPVTMAVFPKYLGLIVPVAVAAWVIANMLGNHILASAR
jgi:hypothetical protein